MLSKKKKGIMLMYDDTEKHKDAEKLLLAIQHTSRVVTYFTAQKIFNHTISLSL